MVVRGLMAAALTAAGAATILAGDVLAQAVPGGGPVVGGGAVEYGIQRRGLESAVALVNRGSYGEAVALYKQLVNQGTEGERGQARLGLSAALAQIGQEEAALRALEGTVADETPLGRAIGDMRGRLLLQLAEKDLHAEGVDAARRWLGQFARLTQAPDHARYNRLMAAVAGEAAAPREIELRVGVLLPLSGPLARVGKDVLDALSLSVLEGLAWPGVRVELKPYDIAALGAGDGAQMALNDGADVLVGPLVSKDVDAVAPIAKSAGVPVLGLSTDRSAAGSGVWLAGYLAADQGRAMAGYARSAGLDRVAGLVPSNPYGYELFDAFKMAAQAEGLDVTASAFYNPDNVDIGASIRGLTGEGGPLPFKALFMPSSAGAMPLIASQLALRDINPNEVTLLGTALWQDPSLLSPSMAGTVRGAVFAVPPRDEAFTNAFKDAYGRAPMGLAVVGYDIGNWLGELAFEHGRSGQGLADILQRPEGFYGAGGYARFLPSGESQRGLSVVRVADAQFETLTPGLNLAPVPLPRNLLPEAMGRGWWW